MMLALRQPRYSKEEFAERGNDLYNRLIRARVEADHRGKFVALDIETGLWELDVDALAACERLLKHRPDSQTWLVRVGYSYIHRIGGSHRIF